MTVHVVTLNGRPIGVYATPAAADAAMAAHRARKPAQWRPVGVGWASDSTTSLTRAAWRVDGENELQYSE